MHPNHNELVHIAIHARLSCAPVYYRILEACEDDGYRKPTTDEIAAIMMHGIKNDMTVDFGVLV